MSGYIVDTGDDEIIRVDNDIEQTYFKPSIEQLKRKKRVLNQLLTIWSKVYNLLNFMRQSVCMDDINEIMNRVCKLWFIEYRAYINYYSDDMISKRSKSIYKIKKLNKIKKAVYIL
jgi:hypothetical protein